MTALGASALGLMLAAAGLSLIFISEVVATTLEFQRFLDRTGSRLLLAGAAIFVAARWP